MEKSCFPNVENNQKLPASFKETPASLESDVKLNKRTMIMQKEKTDLKNSSLIPHLSYLRRKTVRFTLIELLVIKTCF